MQTSERINYIKRWILDYCRSMPKEAKTLVVGISGGIDSSVTSTICALTKKKTIVLSMPIKQIKEQQELSLKHQEWLKKKFKNVESHLVTLDKLFKTFMSHVQVFYILCITCECIYIIIKFPIEVRTPTTRQKTRQKLTQRHCVSFCRVFARFGIVVRSRCRVYSAIF